MSDTDQVEPVLDAEPDLTEEEAEAGFDLGIDVAQPQAQYGAESFDITNDLGYGNGPDQS
jgi:hypothetical protein